MAQDAIDPAPGDPRAELEPRPQAARPIRSENRALLVASIARGRRWLNELLADANTTAERIAAREGCSMRKVNMTISLAFLAPNLVKAAIDGRLPHGMGVARLCELPAEWSRSGEWPFGRTSGGPGRTRTSNQPIMGRVTRCDFSTGLPGQEERACGTGMTGETSVPGSPAVFRASGGGSASVAHQRRRSKWKRHSYTPTERLHLSRGRGEAPPRRLN